MVKKLVEKDTETKILEAASFIFTRDGYAGARMQAIADQAEINKALLHYYFRSKELLFKRIFVEKFGVFFKDMAQLMDSDTDFYLRLDMFVDAYMRMLLSNPNLPIMLLTTMHQNPEFLSKIDSSLPNTIARVFQKEMDADRIIKVHPLHIVTSIVGLCIMPFLARPMAEHVFQHPKAEYNRILEERGAFVKHAIRAILKST